ncbi:ORF3 [Torque teno Tadarida brasiliensis virus 2]|nr:ORF3 [Torque teno Tadarida brasiliensis virus 2]
MRLKSGTEVLGRDMHLYGGGFTQVQQNPSTGEQNQLTKNNGFAYTRKKDKLIVLFLGGWQHVNTLHKMDLLLLVNKHLQQMVIIELISRLQPNTNPTGNGEEQQQTQVKQLTTPAPLTSNLDYQLRTQQEQLLSQSIRGILKSPGTSPKKNSENSLAQRHKKVRLSSPKKWIPIHKRRETCGSPKRKILTPKEKPPVRRTSKTSARSSALLRKLLAELEMSEDEDTSSESDFYSY